MSTRDVMALANALIAVAVVLALVQLAIWWMT